MTEKVFMRRGDHVVEVEATEAALTPLMAQGYHQFHPIEGEPVEFPGAAKLEPAQPGEPAVIGISEAK